MFKKIIAVSTATMLTIAMSASAFATDVAGISDAERELINSLPESLRAEAEDQLKAANVDLSEANVNALVSEVKALETYFKNEKITSVDAAMKALKGDKAAEIEAKITTVASVAKSAGITVDATAIISDIKSGKIASTSDLSQSTVSIDSAKANDHKNKPIPGLRPETPGDSSLGADFSTTAAVVAGLGIAVVGVAVVAKKKDLVNA